MADQPPNPTPPDPVIPEAGASIESALPTEPDPSAQQLAEDALNAADRAVDALAAATRPPGDTQSLELPDFDAQPGAAGDQSVDLGLLNDVHLNVKIELGRTYMYVEDVLRLNENSVVELDKVAGDPVDIYINDRRVARGEVLVLNDNFCVRVSEIIDQVTSDD